MTWAQIYNEIQSRVETAIKVDGQKKCRVYYSAFPADESGNPIDDLNDIAAQGKVILFSCKDEFWGGEESQIGGSLTRMYRPDIDLTNFQALSNYEIAEQLGKVLSVHQTKAATPYLEVVEELAQDSQGSEELLEDVLANLRNDVMEHPGFLECQSIDN